MDRLAEKFKQMIWTIETLVQRRTAPARNQMQNLLFSLLALLGQHMWWLATACYGVCNNATLTKTSFLMSELNINTSVHWNTPNPLQSWLFLLSLCPLWRRAYHGSFVLDLIKSNLVSQRWPKAIFFPRG